MGGRQRASFVGRAEELDLFEDAVAAARSGMPSVVVVQGEAGIGKTRLIAEAAARSLEEHDVLVHGHGLPLTGDQLAFGGVIELVRGLAASYPPDLRDAVPVGARRLLDVWDSHGSGLAGQIDRLQVFDGFLSLVEHASRHHLVWIAIDDLQWLDASSRDLLLYTVRALSRGRLVLSCTVRDTTAVESWLESTSTLTRQEGAHTIHLPALDDDQTAELVTDLLGHSPSPELLDRIGHLGSGLPFLTEELVAAGLSESGRLPTSARELMLGRVAALPEQARLAVEAGAVAVGPVSHDALCQVLSLSPMEVDGASEAALTAHVWDAEPDDRYRFHHELLKQAVVEAMGAGRRRDLHLRWAGWHTDSPEAARLSALVTAAHHWTESGNLGKAFDATLAAAELDEARQAPVEQAPLLLRLIALWDDVPDAAKRARRDRDAMAVKALKICARAGNFEGAMRLVTAELARPDAGEDRIRWIALTAARQSALEQLNRPRDDLPETSRWAAELVGADDGPWLSLGCIELGWRLESIAERGLAFELTSRALEAGRRSHDPEVALEVARRRAHLFWSEGRHHEALTEIDAVLAVVEAELPERLAGALSEQADYRNAAGDPVGAVVSANRALATIPHPSLTPRQYANAVDSLCWALLDLGRWEEAEPPLRLARSVYSAGWRSVDLDLDAAFLAIYRGHLAEADAYVRSAWSHFAEGAETTNPNMLSAQGSARLASGLLAAYSGDVELARQMLRPLLESCLTGTAAPSFCWRVVLVAARAEADATTRSGPRGPREPKASGVAPSESLIDLATAAAEVTIPSGDVGRAVNLHLRAEVARWRGDQTPSDWELTIDAWSAVGLRHDEGWARLRASELFVAEGRRAEAVAQAKEAARIASDLGAQPLLDEVLAVSRRARLGLERTPAPSIGGLAALTDRERDVLALVAEGRTNDQIAGTLFISPKTASVHVSHILAKLQVASRTEAAAHWHRTQSDATS
jgi:DNA-binding CsgD family transcriptional regulator